MSVKEQGWINVARFDEPGEHAEKEKKRIEDLALDLGLMPEKVVTLEENDGRTEVYVHPEFYSYYAG